MEEREQWVQPASLRPPFALANTFRRRPLILAIYIGEDLSHPLSDDRSPATELENPLHHHKRQETA